MDNSNNQVQFLIYTDQNDNLYVKEQIAYRFKIANKGKTIMIEDNKYIKVNQEDIDLIIKNGTNLSKPEYRKCNLVDTKIQDPKIKPTHQSDFIVYTDQNNNTYIAESLAFISKIPNNGKMVMINNTKYMQVTKEEIDEVIKKSNYDKIPKYKNCKLIDKQVDNPLIKPIHQVTFHVYVDQNANRYVHELFAKQYQIANRGQAIIVNNTRHIQVNDEDIKNIIERSKYLRIPEYYSCQVSDKKDQVTNPKYFTYYETVDDNRLYVSKEIAELCREKNIIVSKIPKLIQGKEYYDIAKENLKKFMNETKYVGQKQSIVLKNEPIMKINLCRIDDKMYIPKGLFEKHGDITGRKLIRVDGVEYVQVTGEDIMNTRIAYTKDGINTKLTELKVQKIIKDNKQNNTNDTPKQEQDIDELPKSNITNDIKKGTYDVEKEIPDKDKEEALKKINELAEMLKNEDTTLMLPEGTKQEELPMLPESIKR